VIGCLLQSYRHRAHIYIQEQNPPILEVGFSRQGELCEHFLFGNRKTEHRRKRTEMTDDSRRCFVVLHITDSMAAREFSTRSTLSPAVISRCSSWVMLLLDYVGPQATHFTGYCCWLTKVCGASGNMLYWVLLLVYVGYRATHITGYCCWVYVGPWATHFTGYCCLVYVGLGQHTLLSGASIRSR
jgi:hypothetical protein